MLGMKENLIDMLGTVFANRQNEANVRAAITVEYKEESKKYEAALHELFQQDKVNASIVESMKQLWEICKLRKLLFRRSCEMALPYYNYL